jgi:hypothetical protein
MKENKDDFFNTKTLAKRWHCSTGTIINYAKSDLISYFKTPGGREYRFPKDAIYEYEQCQSQNKGEVNKKPKKKRKALSTPKKIWRVE